MTHLEKRTAKLKEKFLRIFVETCNLSRTAKLCKISRRVHYDWLKNDPQYAKDFDACVPEATQGLDDYLMDWAREGRFEPIVWKGEIRRALQRRVLCTLEDGTHEFEEEVPASAVVIARRTVKVRTGEVQGIYKPSERVALAVAARWMPDKYGNKQSIEVTGRNGAAFIPSEIRVVFEGSPESEELRPGDQDPIRPVEVSPPSEGPV